MGTLRLTRGTKATITPLSLLVAPFPFMIQEVAQRLAAELGGNATVVELWGLPELYNPVADPAQSWVYDPVTKLLNIETP